MPQYFPGELEEDLTRNQEKVMTNHRVHGPALGFLYKREEDFRTEELVNSVSENSGSRVDEYRAGSLLGTLRDEYGLIEGSLEGGSYHWSSEMQLEGDWEDVKQELKEVNGRGKSKAQG